VCKDDKDRKMETRQGTKNRYVSKSAMFVASVHFKIKRQHYLLIYVQNYKKLSDSQLDPPNSCSPLPLSFEI